MVVPIIWSILAIQVIRPTITQIIEALNNAINAKKEGLNIRVPKQRGTFEDLSQKARWQEGPALDGDETGHKDLAAFLQGATNPSKEQHHSLPPWSRSAGFDELLNQVETEDPSLNNSSNARGRTKHCINNTTRFLDNAAAICGPNHPTLSSQIEVARGLISTLSALGKPRGSSMTPDYDLTSMAQNNAFYADDGDYSQAFGATKDISIPSVKRETQRACDLLESTLHDSTAEVTSFLSAQGTALQNRLQQPFLLSRTASAQSCLQETQNRSIRLEPQNLRKRPAPPVPTKPEHLQSSHRIVMIDLTDTTDSVPSCPEPLLRRDTLAGTCYNDSRELSVSERRRFFERDSLLPMLSV